MLLAGMTLFESGCPVKGPLITMESVVPGVVKNRLRASHWSEHPIGRTACSESSECWPRPKKKLVPDRRAGSTDGDRVNQYFGLGIIEELAGRQRGILVPVGALTVKLVGAGFRDQVH